MEDVEKPTLIENISKKWQFLLDRSSPHVMYRWIAFGVSFFIYLLRAYFANGWYIVTYGLGIYLLNQLIGFLSPQFDPDDNMDTGLPTQDSEEFRPFARRVPEFKFWYACIKATIIALFMTFFELFNVPVFWPILLLYFIILFVVTMKRQIKHMIKHRYVPWSFGKAKYASKGGGKESK